MSDNPRLARLFKMLEREPNDAFLLYGVAMEHKKSGDAAAALDYLDRTLKADPLYCYAYYQRGQVQEAGGDLEAARTTYRAGIEAAGKKGDAHAAQELQSALALLE